MGKYTWLSVLLLFELVGADFLRELAEQDDSAERYEHLAQQPYRGGRGDADYFSESQSREALSASEFNL